MVAHREAGLVCTCLGAGEECHLTNVLHASVIASALGVRFMVVAFSPLSSDAHTCLAGAGAVVYSAPSQPSPGAELCNTILTASQLLSSTPDAFIAWMEPDQEDFVRFAAHLAAQLEEGNVDVIAPVRPSNISTYPAEQAHAEALGNLYLNKLLASHSATIAAYSKRPSKPLQIDWFFGPVVMRAAVAHFWHGEKITHQQKELRTVTSLLALLHAIRAGAKLSTPEISYVHLGARSPRMQVIDIAGRDGEFSSQMVKDSSPTTGSAESVLKQWLRLSTTIQLVSEEILEMARATVAQVSASITNGVSSLHSVPQNEMYQLHTLLPNVFPASSST